MAAACGPRFGGCRGGHRYLTAYVRGAINCHEVGSLAAVWRHQNATWPSSLSRREQTLAGRPRVVVAGW